MADAPFVARFSGKEIVLHHPAFRPTGELYTAAHNLCEAGPLTEDLFHKLSSCNPQVSAEHLKVMICDHLLSPQIHTKQGKFSFIGILKSMLELREEIIIHLRFQNDSQSSLIQGLQNEVDRFKQKWNVVSASLQSLHFLL